MISLKGNKPHSEHKTSKMRARVWASRASDTGRLGRLQGCAVPFSLVAVLG